MLSGNNVVRLAELTGVASYPTKKGVKVGWAAVRTLNLRSILQRKVPTETMHLVQREKKSTTGRLKDNAARLTDAR
jgi:hypothetical protein